MIPGETSNRATRAAWLGLTFVVLCLAAFSIIAAYRVQTLVEHARHNQVLHDNFLRANSALLADEAMQLESLVLPSAEHDADRILADQRVIDAFNKIATQSGTEDAEFSKDLLRLHEQYVHVYAGIAAAEAAGDQLEVVRLHNVEDPLYHAMRDQVAAAMELAQAEEEAVHETLETTSQWMLILSPVVFAIGFVLLLGLWRILEQADRARRKTYREIEQLSRLRGEFVSTVSHEFRTPLTGIQGFSEMMRDEVLSLDAMREYAGDINKDAQRLGRLMSDMLDLDQMESGHMTLSVQEVDLNRILVDAAAQFRPRAANHPIELDLDATLPHLSGDYERMAQVVSNLLSNAIKYSPKGGAVELRTKRDARTVTLTVRDHGIGIPTEQLEKIFERYSRVETAATISIQGTGLGLPIVRQIVRRFEGKVWATSGSGEGSVFHVQLPLPGSASLVPRAA
jgi:signal transduction histidine kinase